MVHFSHFGLEMISENDLFGDIGAYSDLSTPFSSKHCFIMCIFYQGAVGQQKSGLC